MHKSVEQQSHTWSFACLARFAQWTKKRETAHSLALSQPIKRLKTVS